MTPTRALLRSISLSLALLCALLAHAAPASAQGRCSCNNGCHQYPGQCVQPGASGCDPGFAPFCGTRASTCPNTGWVSCNGDCTCVRVYSGDAGTADASTTSPTDLGAADAASADRPGATDGASLSDATRPPADATATDLGASDRPSAADAVMTGTGDRPTPPDGSSATADAGCACSGGACIDGACVTERCVFYPELGFECPRPGTTCRLIEGEAYCVPLCAGVSCAEGEFCDESSAGRCVRDDCASRTCPAGTTCRRNQCGNYDGGLWADAGGPIAANGEPMQGGCGCRAAGPAGARSMLGWGVAALFLARARRSRSRR